jgi:hypothetical protein
MCMRVAYQCPDCRVIFGISPGWRCRDFGSWHRFLDVWRGPKALRGVPVKDWFCDNKYCLRRTDLGYNNLLEKPDSCLFCIRYGDYVNCRTFYMYVYCRCCFSKRPDLEYNDIICPDEVD